MLENFAPQKFQQARISTQHLIKIIKTHDLDSLEAWIKSINFDPESLGSAFYMVYQFAEDYLRKNSKAEG